MKSKNQRISCGISGLDDVLLGGLLPLRAYLVRGGPGTGKTTIGMYFLATGVKQGEHALCITLGESAASLKANAENMALDVQNINFLDLSPQSDFFTQTKSYDLFTPLEVELSPITQKIITEIKRIKPQRVFLDSTSHLRYLAIDSHLFRKQLLAFIRFLLEQNATILFTSECSITVPDDDVMYLSDGIINLTLTEHGRRLEVIKFRGSDFKIGQHTFALSHNGALVFPNLKPKDHQRTSSVKQNKSGIAAIDAMLHGGIEQGTTTVISGPIGVGKTTLGLQFLKTVAERGERSVLFTFEENTDSLIHRAESLNIPLRSMVEAGYLVIISIEPLLFSVDEIAFMIRHEVEQNRAYLIMLDSVAGFRLSIRDSEPLFGLRSIFKYLVNMNITSLIINETEAITGDFKATDLGIGFMMDNIIFIRYLELQGEMRKAIGILKKRMSDFEHCLREFALTSQGIQVGEPLTNLRGILCGVPEWVGGEQKALVMPNEKA